MKDLLNKYKTGDISPEELSSLADMMDETPDGVLGEMLSQEWEHFEKVTPPYQEK